MRRGRLLWQMYFPMVIITIVALFLITLYATGSLKDLFLQQTFHDLRVRAELSWPRMRELFAAHRYAQLKLLCRKIGDSGQFRITVILPSGTVICDSRKDAAGLDNHGERPEILEARKKGVGSSIRFSATLQQNMMYLALPVYAAADGFDHNRGMEPDAYLRVSIPVTSIDSTLGRIYKRILGGLVALCLLAASVTLSVSRRISRPLEEMRTKAELYARGDFSQKIVIERRKNVSLELVNLAQALNMMASQLHERIQTITRQRNELEAVFSGMIEAVLVVDAEERILNANQASLEIFGIASKKIIGKPLFEVVRNHDLQKFIRTILSGIDQPMEGEVRIRESGQEVYLQAHGTLLQDAAGTTIGALAVLHDVTRLRILENVRREFVANVSHELKTPITNIKGFVETLRDGAMENPEDAARFLGIVLKHTDRLNAIVDDLLTLSRIEVGEENAELHFTESSLLPPLQAAVENCTVMARQKSITILLFAEDDVHIPINPPLLEQAVTNLIVNAVKYSETESTVRVSLESDENFVYIRVQDQGVGIAAEHLPRLFERFYRSDRARSRKLGGTGLGLAIVKHIVQAHGGTVSVSSVPQKGTVFTLRLPRTRD